MVFYILMYTPNIDTECKYRGEYKDNLYRRDISTLSSDRLVSLCKGTGVLSQIPESCLTLSYFVWEQGNSTGRLTYIFDFGNVDGTEVRTRILPRLRFLNLH